MSFNYRHFFNFLFPPSKDELCIIPVTQEDFISLSIKKKGVHATSLLPYTDKRVQAAIHLAKFHNHPHAKKLLASVLAQHLMSHYAHTPILIIPIPLSSARKRKRGYNQVEEIIKQAVSQSSIQATLCTKLKRTRDTKPQTSLSKKDRLHNVLDAFDIPSKDIHFLSNANILLIDDVITTGATISVARKALEKATPKSITCISLAH